MAGKPSYIRVAVLGVIREGGFTGKGKKHQIKTEDGMAHIPLKIMPLLKRNGYEDGKPDPANIVTALVCRESLTAPTAANP